MIEQAPGNDAAPSPHAALMLHDQRPADALVRGAGSWVWDARGRRYLDFVQGWAVNSLGHSSPVVRRALARQARTLVNASPAFHNEPQSALAATLTRKAGLDAAFFCSTGAEANEGAIKLARKWGRVYKRGAHLVVTTEGSFHGRTLATMAASGKPGWDELFPPTVPGFVKVPHGDADAVAAAIRRCGEDAVAAILVEPIQGEGGVVVPPDGYLRELRAIADRSAALLMFDEVQTGIGRTGDLFAFEHEGVRPDVLTLGKGLGGGVPLAALLASARASCFSPGEQGGTFCGTPLMTAVGLAIVDAVAAPRFLPRVRRRADELTAGLRALAARHGGEVRGRGLLQAWVLPTPIAPQVVAHARELGLLVNSPRPQVLRLMPALTVTSNEIALMLDLLGQAVLRACGNVGTMSTTPSPPSPLATPLAWDLIADAYCTDLVPQFELYTRDALAIADVPTDSRVLDVATGPGTLATIAARELGAQVSAIDFAESMIAHLRRRAVEAGVDIDVYVGDGQALPFADASFDRAFSMFGLMFFPDRAAGLRELHRVLRPGGRAVLSSWAPFEGAFQHVLESVRAMMPDLPFGGGRAPLGDPAELDAELRAAGFSAVQVHTVAHALSFASLDEFWQSVVRSNAPVVLLRRKLGEARWSEVAPGIERELERRLGRGRIDAVGRAHLGVGFR